MGSKPEPPQPPNPLKVSGFQTSSNVQTAITNAWLNNIDTKTPFGTTDFQKTGERTIEIPLGGGRTMRVAVPTFKQTDTLNDDQQSLLDLQVQAQQNLGKLTVDQSELMQRYLGDRIKPNQLPDQVRDAAQAQNLQRAVSPDDFSADRQRVEDAIYSRLNPQLDRDRNSLLTRLANQGVTTGSEAYTREIDAFNRQANDARMQAVMAGGQEQNRLYGLEQQRVDQANRAIQGNFTNDLQSQQAQNTLRQQALQEQIALRNQPISEISQLMHGSQPTVPQFQSWNGPTVANTDVSGNFYRSAALEQQNYLAQMQQQQAMMGGLFGLGGSLFGLFSDKRLKKNIKKVGKLDNGLDVYAYTMNGVPQIGLIAQEVEKVKPWAVGAIGGLKTVRYDLAVEA